MTYAQLIQPILWLTTGGAATLFVFRALWARRKKKPMRNSLLLAAASMLLAFIIVPSIAVVPAGYRGVVYRWNGGVDPTPRGEGVSFIVPWFNHLTIQSVRTQKVFSAKVFAQSADLQEITVVASVNFHVDPVMTPHLYQAVGPRYVSTVVQPALFQLVKTEVGRVRAENFAISRQALADAIRGKLKMQLDGYGIVVEYVNIEDAIFDPAFVKAVKDKIIAQQEAKRQQNLIAAKQALKTQTIINAEAQARSVLIQARAQARANKLVNRSLTTDLIRWRFFDKWDGTLPTTLLGSAAQGLSIFLQPNSP